MASSFTCRFVKGFSQPKYSLSSLISPLNWGNWPGRHSGCRGRVYKHGYVCYLFWLFFKLSSILRLSFSSQRWSTTRFGLAAACVILPLSLQHKEMHFFSQWSCPWCWNVQGLHRLAAFTSLNRIEAVCRAAFIALNKCVLFPPTNIFRIKQLAVELKCTLWVNVKSNDRVPVHKVALRRP